MANGHYIVTDFNVYWTAVLRDYDGAPDAKGPNSLLGWGKTELEAISSLMEQLEEHGVRDDIVGST
jgi:hypothetical protein